MSAGRPLIGVCAALETARWAVWDQPADLLPRMYVEAVQRAGGAAVLLPVDAGWIDDPDRVLGRLDALLLAGGSDIDPATYGAERHAKTGETLPARDQCEIALLRAALRRDMPVLGICRGMQLMNVAAGGTLKQHLPDVVGDDRHLRAPGSFDDADHGVVLDVDSTVARAAGATELATKSHHHQAIDALGEELTVCGRSATDELPEAIEVRGKRFAIGVQWHPEADPGDRVIAALVAAASAAASG